MPMRLWARIFSSRFTPLRGQTLASGKQGDVDGRAWRVATHRDSAMTTKVVTATMHSLCITHVASLCGRQSACGSTAAASAARREASVAATLIESRSTHAPHQPRQTNEGSDPDLPVTHRYWHGTRPIPGRLVAPTMIYRRAESQTLSAAYPVSGDIDGQVDCQRCHGRGCQGRILSMSAPAART
jgi:hypothetical protein